VAPDTLPGGARDASAAARALPAGDELRTARLRGSGQTVGGLVLLALTILPLALGPETRLRGLWFDLCQRLAPRVRASGPAVIVAVDEPSLARYGQWPWPRQLLAQLVDRVGGAKPAAIALNFLFPEADGFSGVSLVARLPGLETQTSALVRLLPDGDHELGQALAAAPSVIGLAGLDGPSAVSPGGRFTPAVVRGSNPVERVRRYRTALRSVPDIDGGAAGHGLLSAADARGGVVRRLPLGAAVGDALVPGLGIEMLRVATGAPAFSVRSDGGGVRAVGAGDVWIPAEADGTMWIHFTPHDEARFVSAAAVLAGDVAPERFERKLVLVGATAVGVGDQHVTPLGERLPGVEVHAQALENMFDGRVLVRPRWAEWGEALALVVTGSVVVALTPAMGVLRAAGLALGLGLALLGGSFMAYRELALLLDGLMPALGLGIVYTATLVGTLAEADRQRRALRQRLQEEREAAARLAGELEAARRIQLGLLPRPEIAFPGEGRFRISAVMEPARVVGGDLFDFFLLDGDRLLFLVGDVSGKGLPASLFMAATKAFYRSISTRHATELASTMREASTEMGRDNPEAFFVTLVAVVLDVNTGRLWYCNAGHEAPWVVRPSTAAVERLEGGGGPPLCVLEGFAYETATARLEAGDTVLLVTDGVTEAIDPRGDLFGMPRVAALVTHAAQAPARSEPAQLVADLVAALRTFREPAEPADDVTLLAVQWLGPPEADRPADGGVSER
jgi:serine phosphatase RsbU (regulator of sigma subunit)/CHASE2 domain-containing sensor protein